VNLLSLKRGLLVRSFHRIRPDHQITEYALGLLSFRMMQYIPTRGRMSRSHVQCLSGVEHGNELN